MEVSAYSLFSNSYQEDAPWTVGISSVITTIAVAILTCGLYHLFSYPKTAPEPLLQGRVTPVHSPPSPLTDIPLEERLGGTVLDKIPCGFQDFRDPNEYSVATEIPPHLEGMNGWIVSTGSERSLFDLLLAPSTCEGLFVRDINWKIKAYIDCIVMLLRISENFSEFNTLITRFEDDSINRKLFPHRQKPAILEKLTQSSLPPTIKNYYLKNLDDLLDCYYDCFTKSFSLKPTPLSSNFFESIDYRQRPELFEKLKHYADSGRIITTVGTIEDLEEVSKAIPIGVIDTSNIHDYIVLDIRTGEQIPKIIWVRGQRVSATYFSYTHSPLSKKEHDELTQLLKTFRQTNFEAFSTMSHTLSNAFFLEMAITGQDSGDICLSYSKELLTRLRDYRTKYIYTTESLSVNFMHYFSQENFFNWIDSSEENLQKVIKDPSFKPFVELLKTLRTNKTSPIDARIDQFLSDFQRYQS